MSLPKFVALFATAALVATFTAGAMAEDMAVDPAIASMTPEEMVAARVAAMKEDGGIMRKAGGLTGQEAVAAADTLIQNFTNLHALFPEGSNVGNSEALPAIWEGDNYAEFTGYLDTALAGAKDMKAAAEAGDAAAYGAALKTIGGTCGACHQKFRS